MEIKIEGMHCPHCVKRIEKALKDNGAKEIKVEIGKASFSKLDEKTA